MRECSLMTTALPPSGSPADLTGIDRSAPRTRTAALPTVVSDLLSKLRQQIRWYILCEGLALLAIVCGLYFWGTFVGDSLYFAVTRWELPRWLRGFLLVGLVAGLGAGFLEWLVFRLLRTLRSRSLAMVLEQRFPELDSRLVTAVELADGSLTPHSPIAGSMLQQMIADLTAMTQHIQLSQVFDLARLRRSIIQAAVLLVSIVGLAYADRPAFERWTDGYLALQDTYWNRETELVLKVVLPPGDRVREFQDHHLRHARGADLMLLVEVPPGKKRPAQVQLDFRHGTARGRSRVILPADGDRPLLHTLPGLLDSLDVRLTGGDFTSPERYRIEVVDPPRLDQLVLSCRYPNYTQLNPADDQATDIRVQSTSVVLPAETEFTLTASVNKPIRRARYELEVGGQRVELEATTQTSTTDGPRCTMRSSETRQQWQLPVSADLFTIRTGSRRELALAARLTDTAADWWLSQAASSTQPNGSTPLPRAWLPADAVLKLTLEDEDGLANLEPIRLMIGLKPDEPPVIESRLSGISTSITRSARIPISALMTDDYGLTSARFEYQLDQATEWTPRDLSEPLPLGRKDFRIGRPVARSSSVTGSTAGEGVDLVERFDVLPLDLSPRQRLTVTVVATDNCEIPAIGPQTQRGQKFVFQIVSNEDLLSTLYARELNLRKRFEQILTELKSTRDDLVDQQPLAAKLQSAASRGAESRPAEANSSTGNGSAAPPDTDGSGASGVEAASAKLAGRADRALSQVRKSQEETLAVAYAFREIRDELINNGVDTPQQLERLDLRILRPLERALEQQFAAIDQALGLYRLALQQQQSAGPPLETATSDLQQLIQSLEQILLEMRKLETFHEALELLKSIIGDQDELSEQTRRLRKERALKALE